MKVGRNDPCPCGSGNKYKKCCLAKDQASAIQAIEATNAAAASAAKAKADADEAAAEAAGGAPKVDPKRGQKPAGQKPVAGGSGTAPPLFRRRSV
jgi:hypothetical protein